MSETVRKTLADDFYERLAKTFRPKFIENVDNPTRLIDYLRCLETIDEERIKAQQIQYGPMHAASILYDLLIRRSNWREDVIRAFRDPAIKLDFLADMLERFELTVPARWDISSFRDQAGLACFNGHCCDTEEEETPEDHSTFRTDPDVTRVKELANSPREVEVNSTVGSTAGSADDNESLNSEIIVQSAAISENTADAQADSWETIRLKRENLRLKMMEKVYTMIQNPQDVPVAVNLMNQINIQLDKIEVGSVIFNIYIDSLEGLQIFEQLWRYGGLKKLLDKEMLSKDMIKELKSIAVDAGLPVEDIRSQLNVLDTDIERCRSWLIKNRFDIRPANFTDALVLMNSKRKGETEITEVAKHALDHLPEELQALIEDPFVTNRIGNFYEYDPLTDREELDIGLGSGKQISEVEVSCFFAKWLNEELYSYFKGLDNDVKLHLLCLAVYLVHRVASGDSPVIPYNALSETFATEQINVSFPPHRYYRNFWSEKLKLPRELKVDNETVRNACRELIESKDRLLYPYKSSELRFYSVVLRDIFITMVVACISSKSGLITITGSFEYVQTLIGMYTAYLRNYFSHEAETEIADCSFKTQELRELAEKGVFSMDIGEDEMYYDKGYTLDISQSDDCTESITEAKKVKGLDVMVDIKRKIVTADCSEAMADESVTMHAISDSLNLKPAKAGSYSISLKVNNCALTSADMESIGRVLNVTLGDFELNLRNCQLEGDLLAKTLQTGRFRNIRHLNMSDNTTFVEISQPLGLMFVRSLERLELQNCRLDDSGIKLLAMDLIYTEKLRELNVANNGMSAKGLLELSKALSTNKRMTGLRIHKNYIGKEGSWILESWLKDLILLEVLNISDCGIGDKGSAAVAKALVSRSLRKLSMRKNEITSKGSREFFKNFQHPPYLEHLDYSENALFTLSDKRTQADAEDLPPSGTEEPFVEFLQHPTPLSHLSLWNTHAGEKRIFESMAHSKCFAEMTYLCLQENNISDDFVKDLSECIKLSQCTILIHLNLRQNRIGTIGAMEIAKALTTQSYLKEVLLDRNEIGDEGGNQIVQNCVSLPDIEHIDLSCNNISQKMMEKIVTELEEKCSGSTELSVGQTSTEDALISSSISGLKETDNSTQVSASSSSHLTSTNKTTGTDVTRAVNRVIQVVRNRDSLDENTFIITKRGNEVTVTM